MQIPTTIQPVLSTHRRRRGAASAAAVALAALTLAVPGSTAGAGSTDTEPTHTGCLDATAADIGRVYAVAKGSSPLRVCDPGDSLIRVSGGDITSIAAGPGLRATSDPMGIVDTEGSATLEVAPAYRLPQNCATGQAPARTATGWGCQSIPTPPPSEIIEGRSPIGEFAFGVSDEWANIADPLKVPAGSWAITAKFMLHAGGSTTCRLDLPGRTGADFAWGRDASVWTLMTTTNNPQSFTVAVACEDHGNGSDWANLVITAVPATKANAYRLEPHS